MTKPDVEIFEYVINIFNIDTEKCLFVDDTLKNIEVAKTLEFNTHLFTDA